MFFLETGYIGNDRLPFSNIAGRSAIPIEDTFLTYTAVRSVRSIEDRFLTKSEIWFARPIENAEFCPERETNKEGYWSLNRSVCREATATSCDVESLEGQQRGMLITHTTETTFTSCDIE